MHMNETTSRTTRAAAIVLGLVVALAAAGAALAGEVAKQPLSLVLTKADFPAGMRYTVEEDDLSGFEPYLESGGVSYKPASYDAISYSKAKGLLHVAGTVMTTASAAQAKKGFAIIVKQRYLPFWIGVTRQLTVPSYGDQQRARLDPAGGEGQWTLNILVRKGATLWLLHLVSERRPALAKGEVLATFTTLARKQKARVGSGS
jgi:hypothetical protein